MENLAGVNEADDYIKEEMRLAGIPIINGPRSDGEVPYSLKGKLENWDFERAWTYWMVSAPNGLGLPLEIASELHERKYPIVGEVETYCGEVKSYGQVIRVAGDCGCPHPRERAFPSDKVLGPQLEKLARESVTYKELANFCDSGKIIGQRFVDSYHIDTQEGLNEFVRVVIGTRM